MIIAILTAVGLCFGSFVNALVWRIRQQERAKSKEQRAKYSIAKGRSMCPHCRHELAARDLIPVFSWILLRGKCRYCKKPISPQYPLVELLTAALFAANYIFWPMELVSTANIIGFIVWLVCLVGFMALIVYDFRYMILPNKIIFPLTFLAVANVLLQAVLTTNYHLLTTAVAGAAVGGGLFYLLFQVSRGNWIGGGDVKLGFLLGLLIGGPESALLMLFLASLLGTIYALPLILTSKTKIKARIPFGPFLIIAAILVQLFGSGMIHWYMDYFLI